MKRMIPVLVLVLQILCASALPVSAVVGPSVGLSEDFEGAFPPAGWTIVDNIGSCNWESTFTTGRENTSGGTGIAAVADSDWCYPMDTELRTTVFSLAGLTAPVLRFHSKFWDLAGNDDAYVDISTDGGATWTNLLHYDGIDVGPLLETVDLSAYAGQTSIMIRFHYVAPGWDWYWLVDDVFIGEVLPPTPTDTDGDGEPDITDGCPNDPNKIAPGICGCGVADTDSDGDGTPDCNDGCPNDPLKINPGLCGCGIPDIDSDGDGILDCMDGCPFDPFKIAPGLCGCGVSDTDSDNDGTPDCDDDCPNDPNKTEPGVCGCGIPDTDSDGDGAADCNDNCPNDPAKIDPGICGCGVSDVDTDNDGTPDCNDNTPDGAWDDYDDDDAAFCDFIPVTVLPVDGAADTSLTPTFVIDYDIDPESCGDHHKTRWQISERPDFYGLTYNKNTIRQDPFSHEVAPGVLKPDTTYYWRARVWCSQGCKSLYSEPVSFTTGPDPNYDGQPGNQGNHSRSVDTVVGNAYITIETPENITFLQALDNQDQDILDGMPANMPWGLINFRIEVANPGDTVQITIYFEEKAPDGSVFYKYDPVEGWIDYSDHATFAADMKSVTIEIQDGGFGDLDGVVNGVIVDPCGIGTDALGGGGGGGGCFIDSTTLTR